MKVFLDCDGVAADFDGYINTKLPHLRGVSDDEFWATLSEIPNFFAQLEPLTYFRIVIHALVNAGHDLEWLTATPHPTKHLCTAQRDKQLWIAQHFPYHIPVTTVSGGKYKAQWLHVYPKAVLIDDYKRNIDMWNEAGGCGILHTSVESTLEKLYQLEII